jgi:hypothetical protein
MTGAKRPSAKRTGGRGLGIPGGFPNQSPSCLAITIR